MSNDSYDAAQPAGPLGWWHADLRRDRAAAQHHTASFAATNLRFLGLKCPSLSYAWRAAAATSEMLMRVKKVRFTICSAAASTALGGRPQVEAGLSHTILVPVIPGSLWQARGTNLRLSKHVYSMLLCTPSTAFL